ncbi:MAG: hypothetical protein K6G31_09440 [Paludibacteraceae bacterium]|nr:hypothetical protein [Paludibacteraceae bacterium]
MKKIVLILQFMLLSFATYAQEQTNYREKIQYEDAKSDIDGSMMEIVHFKDNDNYYRINKETGEVWQLKGEKIYALDVENSPNNTVYKGKINFQLIAGREVYLMNLNTGEIWYLKRTKPFGYIGQRYSFVLAYQE